MACANTEPKSDGGYDVEFVDETLDTDDISCVICLFILRDPVQAVPCGHRFCKKCIAKVDESNTSKLICPIDRLGIQVFPDVGRQREILNFKVKCQNVDEDCPWKGELRDLEGHLGKCDHAIVDCHLGCGLSLKRKNLEEHTTTYCDMILEQCKYSIIGCNFKGKSESIDEHIKKELEYHLFLQVQNQTDYGKTICELETKLSTQKGVIEFQANEINNLQENMKLKEEGFKKMEADVTEKIRKISALENYVIAPKSPYVFVVENATEELRVAKERNKTLYSGSFYCLNGYKARMKIHLNGTPTAEGSSKDTHMSVYFQLLQGPFDEKLQWPMPFGSITFTLLIDENPEVKKQRTIRHTENELVKSFYTKPEKTTGGSRGFGKFIDLKQIPCEIQKDVLKFTVDVTGRY